MKFRIVVSAAAIRLRIGALIFYFDAAHNDVAG